MSVPFHVMIPARFASSRLPGKLLMDLHGQTVLERVYRQARQAHPQSITIATDNQAIFDEATRFGAPVVMTDAAHQSGTDRIAEAVSKRDFLPDDIIVNVQGDEPLIAPILITQVAHALSMTAAPMATLCWPIEDRASCENPNVVKVVRDCHDHALYFSRRCIPANRDDPLNALGVFRHIGLYAYRAAFLQEMVQWPVCAIEQMEALEQLRVLWAGYQIKVEDASVRPLQDINTLDDLHALRGQLQAFT